MSMGARACRAALAAAACAAALLVVGCAVPPPASAPSPGSAPSVPPAGEERDAGAQQRPRWGTRPAERAIAPPAAPATARQPAEPAPGTDDPPGPQADSPQRQSPSDFAGAELERGHASWYGLRFHGRRTASGEPFNMNALTAAHRTLPFGSLVRVKSLVNGREVVVRINDRGPHVAGRIIDLSHAAAQALDLVALGLKEVVLSAVEPGDEAAAGMAAEAAEAEARPAPRARPAKKPAATRKRAPGKPAARR